MYHIVAIINVSDLNSISSRISSDSINIGVIVLVLMIVERRPFSCLLACAIVTYCGIDHHGLALIMLVVVVVFT